MIWIFLGFSEQCFYFQRASQRSIKMTCQALLPCQLLDTVEQPCSPLESLFRRLVLTSLVYISDTSVTAVCTTRFLFCALLSTPPNYISWIHFLVCAVKPSKEALAAQAYHCYLLLVSSILHMVRDIPSLLERYCCIPSLWGSSRQWAGEW